MHLLLVALLALLPMAAQPQVSRFEDARFCGAPERDASGTIKRSTAVRAAFQRLYPCPSTGLTSGSCPGWAINHTIPLACGGCDSVSNMDWMPLQIKVCSEPWCRDRWEREVYDRPGVDTPGCTNRLQSWGR